MKNNKGFTLVELLAVVAILVLILSLITPKIFKQLTTAGKVTDQEQINAIIDTSKLYMNQHSELLPEHNSLYVITLNELKESGLIKTSQILNPSTKEELTGCVVVNYENNKYKYEYNEDKCDKTVTITFDPQRGQLNQTTKKVITGEPYGEMPIPTKEGYTFMGWKGENIFDKNQNVEDAYINISGIYTVSSSGSKTIKLPCNPNTTYYINKEETTRLRYAFFVEEPVEDSVATYINDATNHTYAEELTTETTFTTSNNTKYIAIFIINGPDTTPEKTDSVLNSVIINEKITSDTTVVQDKNHTLKAIWQANS